MHNLTATIFAAAVADGFIGKTPCQHTAPEKPRRVKVRPLTIDQVQALIEAAPERYSAMVVLAAGCGLRLGEVLGLRAHRVRFLARQLDVVEQLVLIPGSPPQLGPPKTSSSVRTVPLPSSVANALALHLERFPLDAKDGLVFRSRTGGPVWSNTFHGSVWQPLVKRAGLANGTRFHDLRHFYASALIAAGESVKTVQAALGHSSAVETLETYAGLWPDAPERTRAAVDAVLIPTAHGRPEGVVTPL